ncbi:uncharacterized protein LOC128663040 [Bombina bombina]|uniref:uncharacterized protein LOC128663040 n=1 Tax=Bombina bombina TaxID=8345 RepID=UPI00235A52E0|nr:uncharacterized protein LOC128663040 [Bombina bombina]
MVKRKMSIMHSTSKTVRFNIWEKEVRDKLLPEAVVAGVHSASRRDKSVRQQRADHQKYSAGRSAPSTSQPSSVTRIPPVAASGSREMSTTPPQLRGMSAGGSHTSQLHSPVITVEESDGVNIDHICFSPSSSVSVVQPSSKHHAPIVDEQHGQTAQNQQPQPEQDKPTEPETQNRYSRTEELLLENLLATKNLTKAVENMRGFTSTHRQGISPCQQRTAPCNRSHA